MHRHYVPTSTLEETHPALDRANSRHFLNVLRLRRGDEVELFDGRGAEATFTITDASRGCVTLERKGDVIRHSPPRCKLVLGACISKGKRMEWTIEKAVELGASKIIPIASRNSVVRLDEGDDEDKRERWLRIAIDAARQCGSPFVPEISKPLGFDEAMRHFLMVPEEESEIFAGALQPDSIPFRDALAQVRTSGKVINSVAWLVGPEGDFSPDEYEHMRTNRVRFVSLGELILRTETAAIYGLCVLGAEYMQNPRVSRS